MDDKEKKLRDHYSTVQDATLLELLNGGESNLIEGAYGLVRDEAIKRKLIASDHVMLEKKLSDVSSKQEKDKSPQGGNNFLDWRVCLMIAFGLTVQQFFTQQHKVENSRTVATSEMMKTVVPKMTTDEKYTGEEIDALLLSAMTAEERVGYLAVVDKMVRGSATRQDMIANGNLVNDVIGRLPYAKQKAVKSFMSSFKKAHGVEMLNALDKQ
ncbi:MAG: hypothetical protein HQL22_09570 [Candidatus Omnitrophica bacterium]|nr:hypothetical protein [Candidatus Omnitrophota bacterium]